MLLRSNYTYTNQESVSASITPATITNITLTRWEGDYDGSAHRITVSGTRTGDNVLYSSDGENYSGTNPSFTEAGTYTVYVKVNRANYNEWTGSAQVVINAVAQIVWYTGVLNINDVDDVMDTSTYSDQYIGNLIAANNMKLPYQGSVASELVVDYWDPSQGNQDYEGYPFIATNQDCSFTVSYSDGTPKECFNGGRLIHYQVNGENYIAKLCFDAAETDGLNLNTNDKITITN